MLHALHGEARDCASRPRRRRQVYKHVRGCKFGVHRRRGRPCSNYTGRSGDLCEFGTDCDDCGSRAERTLGSSWVEVAADLTAKATTKLCEQRCAQDATCKLFYVAFSYNGHSACYNDPQGCYTNTCFHNVNDAGLNLTGGDGLGVIGGDFIELEKLPAGGTLTSVHVKIDCADTKAIEPYASRNTRCINAPCMGETIKVTSCPTGDCPGGDQPVGYVEQEDGSMFWGFFNKYPTRRV